MIKENIVTPERRMIDTKIFSFCYLGKKSPYPIVERVVRA